MIKKQKKTRVEKIVEKRLAISKSGKGKAVIWTRVSSEEQFKTNHSIQTQMDACNGYCEAIDKEVKHCFGGTFESAKVAGEHFLEMIGAVLNDPEVDTIVVFDYDRFSRNMYEGLTYKGQLKRNGVIIKSVNQPIDDGNVLSEQISAILLIIADIDNAMRRSKCYNGMVSCLKRGEWYSKPPLGYDSKKVNKEHQLTINAKGKILRNAWIWIANEPDLSQAKVVERLKSRGLDISKQRLSNCLQNQFYCGRIEHSLLKGEVVKGKQEPLISEALFDKVQSILLGNHKGYEQAAETPRFPLKNHIHALGHTLSGYTVKKKNLDYYKYSGKEGSVNVSAKEAHSKYVELLNEFTVPEELFPILVEVLKKKFEEKSHTQIKDIDNIKKNIATITTQIKTVKKNHAIGNVERDIYLEVIKDLEVNKHKAEVELEKVSANLSNLSEYIDDSIAIACNLGCYWKKQEFEMCQKIQKLVFPQGVEWDKEKRSFLTNNTNLFFSITRSISANYKNEMNKKRDKSFDLSRLVAGGGLEPPTSGL